LPLLALQQQMLLKLPAKLQTNKPKQLPQQQPPRLRLQACRHNSKLWLQAKRLPSVHNLTT